MTRDTLKQGEMMAVTANSSSGSKYYTPRQDRDPSDSGYVSNFPYNSVYDQQRIPNYSLVTANECSVRMATYQSTDHAVVDDITVNTLRAVPTLTVPEATTISVDDVAGFDALEGVVAADACETVTATVTAGEVKAEAGEYTLTYTVTDGYGHEVTATRTVTVEEAATEEPTEEPSEPADVELTVASAGTKIVGRETNLWGDAKGLEGETITARAKINDEWVTVGTSTVRDNGFYVIALGDDVDAKGTYTLRVVAGENTSDEVSLTRINASTADAVPFPIVGKTHNVWGTVPGENPTTVWTEVKLANGKWAKSQEGTTKANGGYILPLTYGTGVAGTYEFRVGATYAGYGTVYSDTVTLTRR